MPRPYENYTYRKMSKIILEIWAEIKYRNPIGVNLYAEPFAMAYLAIKEISDGEAQNRTSESGPRERK